jgi:hypothetical protein
MVKEPKTEERPRGLAGGYLEEALEALHHTGDAASLFPLWAREDREFNDVQDALAHVQARSLRKRFARQSVLFSALAAEAYVNEFLAYYLDGKDREAVDRLSPINKYVVGTKVAFGKQLFIRDAEPVQTLNVLFKHRDKLVHPKPGYGPSSSRTQEGTEREGTFTPATAAKFVLYVATAAVFLVRNATCTVPDMPADVISLRGKLVASYAVRATRRLPDRRAAPEPPLLTQLIRSFGRLTH